MIKHVEFVTAQAARNHDKNILELTDEFTKLLTPGV